MTPLIPLAPGVQPDHAVAFAEAVRLATTTVDDVAAALTRTSATASIGRDNPAAVLSAAIVFTANLVRIISTYGPDDADAIIDHILELTVTAKPE